jgi:hypothetical protein
LGRVAFAFAPRTRLCFWRGFGEGGFGPWV